MSAPEPEASARLKALDADARLAPGSLDPAGAARRANVAFWIYVGTVAVMSAYGLVLGTTGYGQFALR